jgi:hypothetical protein
MNDGDGNDAARSSSDKSELHSSLTLLQRAQAGDRAALDSLIARYLPRLQRWASGRLPRWARDMADMQALVHGARRGADCLAGRGGAQSRRHGRLQQETCGE